jgi:hypothetical protein
MMISIEVPDSLPEGRRSSFKKGIADSLIESATSVTELGYTPEGHEVARRQGKEVGQKLVEEISKLYPK